MYNTVLHSKHEQAPEASRAECSKLPEHGETDGQRTHAKKANRYNFLRSSLFNLCFYSIIGLFCIILLPLLLMPRRIIMGAVTLFIYTNSFLEKHILGLTYEIRGAEHLPDNPPYIIAAKHQSAYETFKLHFLFKDPATILKQELLKIPLWGMYLKKSDVIAIDRSSPRTAITSMKEGAKRIAAQNRPIVIFPQGTRVPPGVGTDKKPYKAGVAHIQKATGLPIIPMATNTGVFYPKNAWCKKPGRVIFEFLPEIKYSDNRKPAETIKMLETALEEKSNALMEEAYNSPVKQAKTLPFVLVLLFAAYSTSWFYCANTLKQSYTNWLHDNQQYIQSTELQINGFPFKMRASLPQMQIKTTEGTIDIKDIKANGWPSPKSLIHLQTGEIIVQYKDWPFSIPFDLLHADFRFSDENILIESSILKSGETNAVLSGTIMTPPPPAYPQVNLDISLNNYNALLLELVSNKIIKQKHAMMAAVVLQSFEKDGELQTSITSQDNRLYLGPVMFYQFPKMKLN